jgi:predicted AlkP superfamily pyrophosphatase or phosphodiesterase
MPVRRHAVLPPLASLCLAACATAAAPPAPHADSSGDAAPAVAAPPPRLIVILTVDQLRPDYFARWSDQLTGGLGRLWREGAVFAYGLQDHAITQTAPGHASIGSGRFPAHTGIVLNDEGVGDGQSPLIGSREAGASPYRFRGSALIDWLRDDDPRSRALGVSRKDRGAILPMGRAKQPAVWWAGDHGFTTSRYYADTLPAWVQEFNRRHPIASFASREWWLARPASDYAEPDSVALEHQGRDFVFPHRLPEAQPRLGQELKEVPWMDSLTVLLAIEGVRALDLGAGPQTDLLNISLSTMDAVGHRYGPDSREVHDMVLRVDRYVGMLLDSLAALRGAEHIALALSADHGVAPLPEARSRDPHAGALFLNDTAIIGPLRREIVARGAPRTALRMDGGMVRLDRDALRRAGIAPDSLADALRRRLLATEGIARVDTPEQLAGADTVRDHVARRWLHMLPPDESVELVASARPYAIWSRARYANHGSPNEYDARVPLIFHGRWFRAGHIAHHGRVVDIAPTLGAVARVRPTERVDGRVLHEALATPGAP